MFFTTFYFFVVIANVEGHSILICINSRATQKTAAVTKTETGVSLPDEVLDLKMAFIS